MTDIHSDRILILDYGSQYTRLIARRVRELGVYSEIRHPDISPQALAEFAPKGVILSGGPASVTHQDALAITPAILALGVPVLGICYGMQALAQQLGGAVEGAAQREYGYARVRLHGHSQLLRDIEDHAEPDGSAWLDVWMSHGDQVVRLPEGFKVIAATPGCPIAGMADDARHLYGLQFHPEVTHTRQGQRILDRFVHEICGCRALWTPGNIIDDHIQRIRAQVGRTACCSHCRVAWIPRWWRRCCIGPSAISSSACSSTPACCARARAIR